MHKWRCANNVFAGYCDGEPDWETKPQVSTQDGALRGGKCKLDNTTCGRLVKFSSLNEVAPPGKFRAKAEVKVDKKGQKKKEKPVQSDMFGTL